MLKELDNSNIAVHLGKASQYKSTYDPLLLVKEPRQSNRTHLNIQDDNLPFVGYDTWHGYEFSCLTDNGVPITGVIKIIYPASSKYIVESKSLKLYLNSFNMERYKGNVGEIISHVAIIVEKDLSALLETTVKAQIFTANMLNVLPNTLSKYKFYETLESGIVNVNNIKCTEYKENPSLLKGEQVQTCITTSYHSSLLKSNCRVTSQPDWGDVYIYYKGPYNIKPDSLLQYIVSFRDECHFHEEICETIYKRIWDMFKPEALAVTCLYVRRGGIDINPTRVSDKALLDTDLIGVGQPFTKTPRQ